MNDSLLLILDRCLRYSLWVFLVAFLLILVFVAFRLRSRRVGLADYFREEFEERYREEFIPINPRDLLLSYRPRMAIQAVLLSGGVAAVAFVGLAFTPHTLFSNFANQELSSTIPLQLTRLRHDRTYQGFSLEGEVWNRGEEPIGGLRAVVEIWKSDRELLEEISARVLPDPLDGRSAGTFDLDYFENSPLLHGYRIRFESGTDRLPHLQGFDAE